MTSYYVQRGGRRAAGFDYALDASSNLFTGESDFEAKLGRPTSLEGDMLLLAAAIFAADRATPRGEREDIARHIHLSVPVVNVARLLPIRPPSRRFCAISRTIGLRSSFVQLTAIWRIRSWTPLLMAEHFFFRAD